MTKAKVITIFLAAIAIVVSIGPLSTLIGTTVGIAGAQMLLIDDFESGNDDGWTRMPLLPPASGPPIYDASSGAYQLKSTGLVAVGVAHYLVSFRNNTSDPLYSNGYLRGKVRVDAEGTIAALLMRARVPGAGPGYLFAADTESNQFSIQGGIGNRILARMDGPDAPTFNVGEDWYMEGGAVGNQLSLKVWKVGEPEPSAPQLELTNSDFSDGELAVAANVSWLPFPEPALVDATFDDIYFTPVPEPSGGSLASLIFLSLVLLRRRAA